MITTDEDVKMEDQILMLYSSLTCFSSAYGEVHDQRSFEVRAATSTLLLQLLALSLKAGSGMQK